MQQENPLNLTEQVPQITVKTESGIKTKLDIVGKDTSGNTAYIECKSSETAPLTKNQAKAFPKIKKSGATVVGKGKPSFEGGTRIPPTDVKIIRPNQGKTRGRNK
ncbi:MAG: hypothetical protein IJ566_00800 [Cardiobacteriaceae bacterium]|nr:hypothetical protein [Cardiobacteriaceae bacterium]